MKSGWRTTEFWVTAATVVGALIAAIAPHYSASIAQHAERVGGIASDTALLVAGIAAGCYALSRAAVKRGQSQGG